MRDLRSSGNQLRRFRTPAALGVLAAVALAALPSDPIEDNPRARALVASIDSHRQTIEGLTDELCDPKRETPTLSRREILGLRRDYLSAEQVLDAHDRTVDPKTVRALETAADGSFTGFDSKGVKRFDPSPSRMGFLYRAALKEEYRESAGEEFRAVSGLYDQLTEMPGDAVPSRNEFGYPDHFEPVADSARPVIADMNAIDRAFSSAIFCPKTL